MVWRLDVAQVVDALANVLGLRDQFAKRNALGSVVHVWRFDRTGFGHDEHQQIGEVVANGFRVEGIQQSHAQQLQRLVHGTGRHGWLCPGAQCALGIGPKQIEDIAPLTHNLKHSCSSASGVRSRPCKDRRNFFRSISMVFVVVPINQLCYFYFKQLTFKCGKKRKQKTREFARTKRASVYERHEESTTNE